MSSFSNSDLADAVLYVVASIVALVAIVAINQWSRVRRERAIYRKTRLDAHDTVVAQRQAQQRTASD
jgi:hypothetical protein